MKNPCRYAVVTVALVACEPGSDPPAAHAVPQWQVSPAPSVVYAVPDDHDPLFSVVSVLALSTGEVLVASGGSQRVEVFGPEGNWRQGFGGPGSGPGQFQYLQRLVPWQGDTLVTLDGALGRLAFVRTTEGVVRHVNVPDLGDAQLMGRFGGDIILAMYPPMAPMPSGSVRRDSVRYLRVSGQGTVDDTLAGQRGVELASAGAEAMMGDLPLGNVPLAAFADRMAIVGESDGKTMAMLRPDEAPGVIPMPFDRREVTEADVAAVRASFLDGTFPGFREEMERFLDAVPVPEMLPAADSVALDDAGRIWIRRFRAPGTSGDEWLVLGAGGDPIAMVTTPARFELMHITGRHLLGVQRDDDDVETVVRYDLQENEPER